MLFLSLAAIGTCNLGSISLDLRRQFLQAISDLKKIVIIDFLLFFLSKSKAECPVFVACLQPTSHSGDSSPEIFNRLALHQYLDR